MVETDTDAETIVEETIERGEEADKNQEQRRGDGPAPWGAGTSFVQGTEEFRPRPPAYPTWGELAKAVEFNAKDPQQAAEIFCSLGSADVYHQEEGDDKVVEVFGQTFKIEKRQSRFDFDVYRIA